MRILSVCITMLLLASCHMFGGERISGNGRITTRQKDIGNFHSIDVSGSITIHLRQDPVASLQIKTDENLIEYLEIFTENNTAVIRTKRGYNLDPSKDIVVYVSAPSFRDIEISGSSDVIGDGPISGNEDLSLHISGSGDITMNVAVPKVSAEMSGSCSIKLKGTAQTFTADVSGSGDVKCFDLVTDNTDIDISGSAGAEVNANKKLNIQVSGSGDVQYRGSASVDQHVSGSGSVTKAG